jgi:bifunctional non-homologous end joining protein LigD
VRGALSNERPYRDLVLARWYLYPMLLRRVVFPDFCEPCLPSPAAKPPAGAGWLHEIKHDGFRMLVRRDAAGVRLLTRNGHDWGPRYPLIIEAVVALRVRSCLIDGEAVCCDDNGVAVFAKLHQRRNDRHVLLRAFDLLELDGKDLRRDPLERRKVLLMRLLARARVGLQVNDHIAAAGDVVFRHACQLGFEGIVSKRLGSPYISGRSRTWLKFKNPAAPAVKRKEALAMSAGCIRLNVVRVSTGRPISRCGVLRTSVVLGCISACGSSTLRCCLFSRSSPSRSPQRRRSRGGVLGAGH